MTMTSIDVRWCPAIGERVRVRRGVGRSLSCAEIAHGPEEQGATGTICADHAGLVSPSHRYLVMLDRPYPEILLGPRVVQIAARHYAADELESLG